MKEFKVSNKGTTQLFSNPFLERLTRTPFAFPVTFYYLLAIAVTIYYADNYEPSLMEDILMFLAGMIFFTLIEYLIHRFIFHLPTTTEKKMEFQYSIHGVHHEFPKDKDRLVMPPIISMFLLVIFFFLFKFIFADQGMVFFAGFSAGYSTYLIIHYAIHRFNPPKNFLRFWWKHHSLHHYHSTDAFFSVSFPLWDILFGTMAKDKSRAKPKEALQNLLPDRHVE